MHNDGKKIKVYDIWDGYHSFKKFERAVYSHTQTTIILDSSREHFLYWDNEDEYTFDEYVNSMVALRNYNSENGNRLILIVGAYKLMPNSNNYDNTFHKACTRLNDNMSDYPDNTLPSNRIKGIHDRDTVTRTDAILFYGLFHSIETWPTYHLAWSSFRLMAGIGSDLAIYDTKELKLDRLFCLKIAAAKTHRFYLLNELERRKILTNKNFWSMMDTRNNFDHVREMVLGNNWIDSPDYHYKSGRMVLDDYGKDIYRHQPKGYRNSLIDIVSETFIDAYFYTEKTACPILYRKPFLINGAQYQNHELQNLGFVLYDDIIDYSFDKIELPRARTDALCDEILRLQNEISDYKSVYIKLLPKLEHNLRRLLEIIMHDEYMPNCIKEYGKRITNPLQMPDPMARHGNWLNYVSNVSRNEASINLIRTNEYLRSLIQ